VGGISQKGTRGKIRTRTESPDESTRIGGVGKLRGGEPALQKKKDYNTNETVMMETQSQDKEAIVQKGAG